VQVESYASRKRIFMSQEQQDAANWQQFQNYKELMAKQAALQGKLQQWGLAFERFSSLAHLPYMSPDMRGIIRNLPNRDDVVAAADEMDTLSQQIEVAKAILRKAGMDLS
jgi:hypothetical protein